MCDLVSVLDPSAPKPLLQSQLELEARVGIGQESVFLPHRTEPTYNPARP